MSDKKVFKFAMVGTGIIAPPHLDAIKKNDETELVAVADINEESAKKTAEEYGVPYFTDYKEMAEKVEMDAVILNLPHFLHCEVTIYFLEKGINVLCEKPMANTAEECDKMIEAEKRSTAKLAIAHPSRASVSNGIIKDYIDNKTLGDLCMITEIGTTTYFTEQRPKWFIDRKLSGGGLIMNYGAHSLETITYVTGGEVTDINADMGNLTGQGTIEGHSMIKFKLDGKIPCSLTFCGYTTFASLERIFYFTNGALKQINGQRLYVCDTPNGEFKTLVENDWNRFHVQLDNFVKYLKGEECNIVSGEFAKKIIVAINEMYDQCEGKWQ